jgi:hypothetical protein
MYAHTRQASEYHRDLLARAQEQRQVARILALRKAARRVARGAPHGRRSDQRPEGTC